jgi:hypothetical protein
MVMPGTPGSIDCRTGVSGPKTPDAAGAAGRSLHRVVFVVIMRVRVMIVMRVSVTIVMMVRVSVIIVMMARVMRISGFMRFLDELLDRRLGPLHGQHGVGTAG